MSARDLNSPMPSGRIVDAAGMPTLQFQNFIQRIWQRTGFAPGQDITWLTQVIDEAVLSGAQAQSSASSARLAADQARVAALIRQQADLISRQQAALDTATIALARSQAREQRMQSALDSAFLALAKVQTADQKASKALETARDSAILAFTARRK